MMNAQASTSLFARVAVRERVQTVRREAARRAAVRMFNARGFQAKSLHDVAAGLGVSKLTLYRDFGKKVRVVKGCIDHGRALLHEAGDGAQGGRDGAVVDLLLRSVAPC